MYTSTLPRTMLTHEKAQALAKMLTAENEDGWIYKAMPTGEGSRYSMVMVYDDEGQEMGSL